jgi:hypothetical protein
MNSKKNSSSSEKEGLVDPPPSALEGKALERAHEHIVRMLDRDAVILDQMRNRASFLITALAIGGTILGAILSNSTHGSPPWWVVTPLGLAIIPCIGILWPTRDHGVLKVWIWTPSGSAQTIERLREPHTKEQRLRKRWHEWRQAHKFDLRLWKTGLGKNDFNKAQIYAAHRPTQPIQGTVDQPQPSIDQVLVERMYVAHFRNDHTLTRRADLLRVAALFTLLFFTLFSIWLPSSSSSSTAAKHSSSTASPTRTRAPTVTVRRVGASTRERVADGLLSAGLVDASLRRVMS